MLGFREVQLTALTITMAGFVGHSYLVHTLNTDNRTVEDGVDIEIMFKTRHSEGDKQLPVSWSSLKLFQMSRHPAAGWAGGENVPDVLHRGRDPPLQGDTRDAPVIVDDTDDHCLQVSCGHQLITFSDPKHRVDTGEVHTLEMIISLSMGQVGAP